MERLPEVVKCISCLQLATGNKEGLDCLPHVLTASLDLRQ